MQLCARARKKNKTVEVSRRSRRSKVQWVNAKKITELRVYSCLHRVRSYPSGQDRFSFFLSLCRRHLPSLSETLNKEVRATHNYAIARVECANTAQDVVAVYLMQPQLFYSNAPS